MFLRNVRDFQWNTLVYILEYRTLHVYIFTFTHSLIFYFYLIQFYFCFVLQCDWITDNLLHIAWNSYQRIKIDANSHAWASVSSILRFRIRRVRFMQKILGTIRPIKTSARIKWFPIAGNWSHLLLYSGHYSTDTLQSALNTWYIC